MFVGCHELSRTQQFSFNPFKSWLSVREFPPTRCGRDFVTFLEGGIFERSPKFNMEASENFGGVPGSPEIPF